MAKVTGKNLKLITTLKVAKHFANIGYPIVGFEGKDKDGKYFELRMDYDPIKNVHVNVTINGDETQQITIYVVFLSVRTYLTTPCTFYFLINSVDNTLYITINVISRIVSTGYGIDLTQTSIVWCKTRGYLLVALTLQHAINVTTPTAAFANSTNIVITGAHSLATQYSSIVRCLRSVDSQQGYLVYIDNMMNLELLFEVSNRTKDQYLCVTQFLRECV
ncbi:hypothetical protein I4U23_022325 [Adineta vaga]|nr:hypothetical protein I4U23_022325 [Adineta vaga]